MSESKEIELSYLYSLVLRESESDSLQDLDVSTYESISKFISKLKNSEYDGIEAKTKNSLTKMISEMTSILLNLRLDKAQLMNPGNTTLLDEEKFIMDSREELLERKDIILSGILHGKSKLLESISIKHKTKPVIVRFLTELDQIIGVDMKKYGPFKTEDIASLPYDNAQALISNNIVMKIHWND